MSVPRQPWPQCSVRHVKCSTIRGKKGATFSILKVEKHPISMCSTLTLICLTIFFFFASMRVQYDITLDLVTDLEYDFHGQCIDTTPYSVMRGKLLTEKTKCSILIRVSCNNDRKTRLTFYLGALLHQMIHTFLAINACRVRGCNQKPENEGEGAHGEAWGDIALAVERGAKMTFNLDLELCRKWSYVWEVAISGPESQVSEKISLWGFNKKELRRQVSCLCSEQLQMECKERCSVNEEPWTFERPW